MIALETFQGSRTPVTDPMARGALLGLSLSHTRAHVWRALMEGVCLGTRAALEALYAAGYGSAKGELLVAGGATRSPLWLQMHADVTGLAVVVGEFDNAPLLGAAVLAAVGSGRYGSVAEAVRAMVRPLRRVEARPEVTALYDTLFDIYRTVAPTLAPISHRLVSGAVPQGKADKMERFVLPSGRTAHIVPSVLAADQAALATDLEACRQGGATWIHVDVCDGGALCQKQLTIGPLTVRAMHRHCPDQFLDVHVVARDSLSLVSELAIAGAGRFTFQYECMGSAEEALALAAAVRRAGMKCGVSLSPSTPIEDIYFLLNETWTDGEPLVDFVDILAVLPGVGGQKFDLDVLQKIERVRAQFPDLPYIGVDGGVSPSTATMAAKAGANVLIAGTAIFGMDRDSKQGVDNIGRNIWELFHILCENGK